ncbi:VIT1/CCC1 transporter family protein [Phocaeicola paurosaccharolyticus]|jgi:VIT1/CCC1 family predicted Fe2+/Mn2+ transporter|uniref:VIT1/CCC1 transporter family protein n=1 Tax=Phocaeicola paurosaccharolyticus TaxID=732242 RepID=UPI00046A6BD0|nr:VIT1/CCC1 transporter family protein [Phocaeicola paurosaccharolyticus]
MSFTKEEINSLIAKQRDELTESLVYEALADIEKNPANKEVFLTLSHQERSHANILKKYTNAEVKPDLFRVKRTALLSKILGITFTVKQMESKEEGAQEFYNNFKDNEDMMRINEEENEHEKKLIEMIDEERLGYMSSVVLGLNDALVEFTGALAGFTLALNNPSLIALTGSITGIAAALSMGSSEYLSTKSEKDSKKHPVKASIYTGITYLSTVLVLVSPFIILNSVISALVVMLILALIIIALFNYYYAVAKGESFKHRFAEMAILSFSVAGISFLIGYALRTFTGIEA